MIDEPSPKHNIGDIIVYYYSGATWIGTVLEVIDYYDEYKYVILSNGGRYDAREVFVRTDIRTNALNELMAL